jgi:ribosomal protein L44E
MNVFCKSHSHHGHKLHSLSKNNKKKQNFPERQPERRFKNFGKSTQFHAPKRKKRKSPRAYYFSPLPPA